MKISFEQVSGFIRHILTLLGGFMVTANLAEQSLADEWTAAALIAVGALWSFFTGEKKAVAWSSVQGLIRHSLTIVAGALQGAGIMDSQIANQLASVAFSAMGFGWSFFAKEKAMIGHNGGPDIDPFNSKGI